MRSGVPRRTRWLPRGRHRVRAAASAPAGAATLAAALALLAAAAPTATAQEAPVDTLAELQSINSFNPLLDGQPGTPGVLEFQWTTSWAEISGTDNPVFLLPQLNFTPRGTRFLRNAQFLLLGLFETGASGLQFDNLILAWQQRWVADVPHLLSVASFLQAIVPGGIDEGRSGIGGSLTGIVARSSGPLTLYLNGTIGYRAFGPAGSGGAATGFHWLLGEAAALTGSYVYFRFAGEPGQSTLNLSAEYALTDRFIIGPGFLVGLGSFEITPRWGLGVLLTLEL